MYEKETLCSFMDGYNWALGGRVDSSYFHERAVYNRMKMNDIRQDFRTQESSLNVILRPAGFLFGAACSFVPQSTRFAIFGALQDTIADEYNDQIRELTSEDSSRYHTMNYHAYHILCCRYVELKAKLRDLRDQERMPAGSLPPPELANLQRIEELSVSQSIGSVVKGVCRLTMFCVGKYDESEQNTS